jgi:hypothetical protein
VKAKFVVVFVCMLLIVTAVPAVVSININDADRFLPEMSMSGSRTWSDNFDSYATGSPLHGQGGWEAWDNNPDTTAYVVDDQARSTPNSCEITWFGAISVDIVQQFTDINSGDWIISSYLYVPSTMSGNSYFILMNDYQHGGPHNTQDWSLQIQFSASTGKIWDFNNVASELPLVMDDWAELRVEIDFEADIQTVYYDGTFLLSKSWKDGVSPGGAKNLAAIDLYADSAASTSVYWDDMSLARPEALSCSANGPYEGIVGEEIQFEGTASGGSTPYEFLWNFGDGETSTEEDPIHIYTDAGDFTVSFTVTDADQTVVSDVTSASIIGVPVLEIKKVEGGLLKVKANVKNAGSEEATDVQWSIVLSGGLIILGKETTGQITIPVGITETITSGLIFGIGAITIIVSVEVPESSDTTENTGFVLLFFINVNPGGG